MRIVSNIRIRHKYKKHFYYAVLYLTFFIIDKFAILINILHIYERCDETDSVRSSIDDMIIRVVRNINMR